ncbi:MAG: hypothetical protein PCFJNLEI_03561 [Verrucomicrobiae bacterium]|nr:hypothetical protein [Verrucomicrobiae bacterium]
MTKPTRSKEGPVVRFSVSLAPEVAAKLKAYCGKHERTQSWVVEKLIARYLEKLT